jgi:hypothetical protein
MKLSISIICLLSFCLVTLVVQKQVQGSTAKEKEKAEALFQVDLKKFWASFISFLSVGFPRGKEELKIDGLPSGKTWGLLYDDIYYLKYNKYADYLADNIPEFIAFVKNVETAVLHFIANPTIFTDSLISNALEQSIHFNLNVLRNLKKDDRTGALVDHMREIINAYEGERTRRASLTTPVTSGTPDPTMPPVTPVPPVTTEEPVTSVPLKTSVTLGTPVTTKEPEPTVTTKEPEPTVTTKEPEPTVTTKEPEPSTTTTTTTTTVTTKTAKPSTTAVLPATTEKPEPTVTTGKLVPSVSLVFVVVSLILGLFVGGFLIGPMLHVQGPSPMRKKLLPKRIKEAPKGTKKVKSGKGTGKANPPRSKAPLTPQVE